ncbi:MAG: acyl-CoA dehydrogenase [Desulfobacterales bacterium CG23_combo_of_CG06-09_8_20_14_all_51_8]|nr:MAG: acyl-CoA dehydrogenase [Desulfobacterales bacterium CG23_combo_of_CG06-09_8_20_14_all_51_8]
MYDFLLPEEIRKIRDEARDLVRWVPREMIIDMDADKIKFLKEFLQEAARRNLLGCRYPKKWGGRGLNWVAASTIIEEIGTLGYIFACTFGVGAELVCDAIILHGTDEQKEKYVKPLLRGQLFAAECLTEPRGGSDFFGTSTIAEDRSDHFVINGQKRFIVGAEGADYFLVYAKTDPVAAPHNALTCLIVDRGPGVETKYLYGLMGCRGGGAGRLVFKDVKVPKENVIGEINGAYPIFKTMMIPERLGTAAMTIGSARPALEIATEYTTRRKAFGQAILHFQGVNFQVAEAAMLLDACRSIIYTTSCAVDRQADSKTVRRLVSESKKFVTEACQKVAHNAMQVMGGIGYTNVYPIERIVRDLRLATIWTGSNEIMSMIIANEWYQEHFKNKQRLSLRNYEDDALEADAPDEKIFE